MTWFYNIGQALKRNSIFLKLIGNLYKFYLSKLDAHLFNWSQNRETAEFVKKQKTKAANNPNKTSNLYGLEEHYEPIRKGGDKNQFAFQDRVFSRWACTIQMSSNGINWIDCPEMKYCSNCGDKTLICPHKMSINEMIVSIPANTIYLKFSRPKLQYNQMIVKRSLDMFKKQYNMFNEEIELNEQDKIDTSVLTNYPTYYSDILNENPESIKILSEGNPEIGMPHNFHRLWFDFSQRTAFKRQVSRPFTFVRCLFHTLF